MKEVKFVSARTRKSLLDQINVELKKDTTAELVGVVERNKLYTAFIQYETDE